MSKRFFLSFAVLFFFFTRLAQAQETLTNQSILNMHQNKVSGSIMVDKIRASHSEFDVSTDGLLQLLNSKVSDSVLEAMMQGTKMTDILTNADVIKLKDANMSRKLLIQKINGSRTQFDMSTTGLIQLKNGKVPDAIQKIMMSAPVLSNVDDSGTRLASSPAKSSPNPKSAVSGRSGSETDMKGVQCKSWIDKFTKKNVMVSRVILRGKKISNILLGRSASTLAGVEDMEVTLLFRRDDRNTSLVLYATKPGSTNLLVERDKTLMFLMNDDSVVEFKPIMDAEYGVDFDYSGYNLDSKLCVYYGTTENQLRILSKKLIKGYRLNTYNRHANDDTVNQSRAEQVQVAVRCMLDELPASLK